MKRLLFVLLALILTGGLIFSGCTKTSEAPSPTTAAPSTTAKATTSTGPQYGGILKIIVPPGLKNLGNPNVVALPDDPVLSKPACESLFSFGRVNNVIDYIPELATNYKWDADYKSLTLTLRQGVKFQDGTDFNAEAVKYNLDIQRKTRSELKSVTSIDIIDNYTVRLNLPSFDRQVMTGLCSPSGWMVSPTAVKTMGDAATLNPVGTGAFKFVSYQTDVSLKYEKWSGYWQKGKPYLDGIEFVFIKDPVTQLSSFKAGEAQVIKSVKINDVVEMQATGKYNVLKYPGKMIGLVGDSSHSDSIFANIKVRRAMAYALDNAAISKVVGFGLYDPSNQFTRPGSAGYNPKVVGYPYNTDKAKQLLTEAGYPSGFETKITYDSTNPQQQSMCAAVQGYFSAVGIKASLDAADPARYTQVTAGGWNKQLVTFLSAVMFTGDEGAMSSFYSSKAFRYDPKSLLLPADFESIQWKAESEPDKAKRIALFQEMHRILIDDYCLGVPVTVPYNFLVKTLNVRDLDMQDPGNGEWHPENAWLSK